MQARIVLLASGDIGCATGLAIANSRHRLEAVVYPPAKPKGRGKKLCLCPVGNWSQGAGYKCIETKSIRKDEVAKAAIKDISPDFIVVADFGQFIPDDVIAIPKYACINVHPSLLPKYRGAAPINWAIINGEQKTGVSIIYVTDKMDAGDIILQEETFIEESETAEHLEDRLAKIGGRLALEAIEALLNGTARPIRQDEKEATFAPKLTKEDGFINWNMDAHEIERRIRGLKPWPGTYTLRNGKLLHIKEVKVSALKLQPGSISVEGNRLFVGATNGSLEILLLQPEGKYEMTAAEFINGYRPKTGDFLGG